MGCHCLLSGVWPFAIPCTVPCQAPLSIEFSRPEYWSGLPCFPPGDLPNPGIEPSSLMSPALTGAFSTKRATWEAYIYFDICPQFLAQSSYNPWNFLSNRECIGLAKKFFWVFLTSYRKTWMNFLAHSVFCYLYQAVSIMLAFMLMR